jgi:hypothetical protein
MRPIDRGVHSFDATGGVEPIFLSLLPNGRQDTVTHSALAANCLSLLGVQPRWGE